MPKREAILDTVDPQNAANFLSIDRVPFLELRPGLHGRYGLVPVTALQANPHAARNHAKRQIKKLVRSVEIAGMLSPVIVDETYVILAGHARVEAVKFKGDKTVPVVQVKGATEAQKRMFLLADNRIAEDAEWDRKKLAIDLPGLTLLLNDENLTIDDTGFDIAEIDQLTGDLGAGDMDLADEIDPTMVPDEVTLVAGDLLQLGDHRLMVGDARESEALDKLCDGRLVSAAFLDPPYNVRVSDIGGRGRIQHDEFACASGEMSRAEYVAFLQATAGQAARVSEPGAVHFICTDGKHVRDLVEAAETVYAAYITLVVWNKTNAGQGGLYRNQHELIGVFRVGKEQHLNNVQMGRFGRNRSNVWTYAGVNTFRQGRLEDLAAHPTVKPVQLVADSLKDCTRPGDAVLDTFSGSGTTLLAAEKVGRHALAMEIEPKFAEVAVQRWQALTGRDAIHVQTGLTFDDLVAKRRSPPARTRVRQR